MRAKSRRGDKSNMPGHFPYLVRILDWSSDYHFAMNPREAETEPFWEYRAISLVGEIIAPFLPKVETTDVMLWPEHFLEPEDRARAEPQAIGHMTARAGKMGVNLYMPSSAWAPLLTALAAGKFRYVSWSGDKLKYGRGRVGSFSLDYETTDESLREINEIWAIDKKPTRKTPAKGNKKPVS